MYKDREDQILNPGEYTLDFYLDMSELTVDKLEKKIKFSLGFTLKDGKHCNATTSINF